MSSILLFHQIQKAAVRDFDRAPAAKGTAIACGSMIDVGGASQASARQDEYDPLGHDEPLRPARHGLEPAGRSVGKVGHALDQPQQE